MTATAPPARTASIEPVLSADGGTMASLLTIKHVPWTCRWGRFGGPVDSNGSSAPGFVFWVCGHPETMGPKVLGRDSCETCVRWEPPESLAARGAVRR